MAVEHVTPRLSLCTVNVYNEPVVVVVGPLKVCQSAFRSCLLSRVVLTDSKVMHQNLNTRTGIHRLAINSAQIVEISSNTGGSGGIQTYLFSSHLYHHNVNQYPYFQCQINMNFRRFALLSHVLQFLHRHVGVTK